MTQTDGKAEAVLTEATNTFAPLSSLLFNTVLQYSVENNLTKWKENKKKYQAE